MKKGFKQALMALLFLFPPLSPAYAVDTGRPHGVTSDGTTGTTVLGSTNYTIGGGDQRGVNLFHSFDQFNIHGGESATFTDGGISNNISF